MHFSWVQRFDSLTDLQSSQTSSIVNGVLVRLIPLLIYKALKHALGFVDSGHSLIPLLIYKALKLNKRQIIVYKV